MAELEQKDKAFSSKHVSVIIAAAAAAAIMTGTYLLFEPSMFNPNRSLTKCIGCRHA